MSSQPTTLRWVRVAATAFSLVVALSYFLIGTGFVADDFQSPPTPVMIVAGFAYLVGGILILRAGRRLLALGAAVNLLVIIIFIATATAGNATVDLLSIIGKLAQISLGILLFSLVGRRKVFDEHADKSSSSAQ